MGMAIKKDRPEIRPQNGTLGYSQEKPQNRTYTINDIVAILGIGRTTAYKLANSGVFKAIRDLRQQK